MAYQRLGTYAPQKFMAYFRLALRRQIIGEIAKRVRIRRIDSLKLGNVGSEQGIKPCRYRRYFLKQHRARVAVNLRRFERGFQGMQPISKISHLKKSCTTF